MSTVSELLTRVRLELEESTAEEWSDALLIQYINDDHKRLMSLLANIPNAGWGSASETFTVAASTETYDISGLTYELEAINTIWHQLSSQHEVLVKNASEAQFQAYRLNQQTVNSDTTPAYKIVRTAGSEYLHFLPLSSATRTFRIEYDYVPATLTSGQSLHTPKRYDDLLAAMVKKRALATVGESDDALELFIRERSLGVEDREGSSASRSVAPRIDTEWSAEIFD